MKWLDRNNVNYRLIDIVTDPPLKKFLEMALVQFSFNKKKLFNTRGKSFQLLDFDINDLSDEKIIELLSKNGRLINRPFLLINESKLLLGFNESEYVKYCK